jgi:hypothetical protein
MALFQVFLAVYKYSAWQNVSLWIWPTQIVDICSLADSTDASLFSVPLCAWLHTIHQCYHCIVNLTSSNLCVGGSSWVSMGEMPFGTDLDELLVRFL